MIPPPRQRRAIDALLYVMASLRSPQGCPWDREQDHKSLRYHAVEEVYELLDAIDANDNQEMAEELGDLLLQVVFHCQLAAERKSFDFENITRGLVDKLVRRHPHVFGDTRVRNVDQVWVNWEKIKRAEKTGTAHERSSALDGIPKHLPALMRAQKLVKKARKAGLSDRSQLESPLTRTEISKQLFKLASQCEASGWSAEDLLRGQIRRQERIWRSAERKSNRKGPTAKPAGVQK